MADAAARDLEDGEDVAALQEETSSCPNMPHLQYSASELDTRYPPLAAPADDGLVDVTDDRQDAVYQHGLGIAKEIREQVATQGRRRRPLGQMGGSAEDPHPAVSVVKEASSSQGNMVDHKEVFALRWQTGLTQSSSLRRSGKLWLPFRTGSRICKADTRKISKEDRGRLERQYDSDSEAASVCCADNACFSHCHFCPRSILQSHR